MFTNFLVFFYIYLFTNLKKKKAKRVDQESEFKMRSTREMIMTAIKVMKSPRFNFFYLSLN